MGAIPPILSMTDPLYGAITSGIEREQEEPPQVTTWLNDVYKLGNPDQVNWSARRTINPEFYRDIVLPSMYGFLEKKIRKITESDNMNALIGLSGGLDSTVASYITAAAMQEARKSGIKVNLIGKDLKNLENLLDGKKFKGTIIS